MHGRELAELPPNFASLQMLVASFRDDGLWNTKLSTHYWKACAYWMQSATQMGGVKDARAQVRSHLEGVSLPGIEILGKMPVECRWASFLRFCLKGGLIRD